MIAFDPYTYTHGTWIHRNDERQAGRKLQFNFDALLGLAIDRTPGATRVLSCDKKVGGFNRVFVVRLDSGKSVIARLPTKLAGPPRTTVSSEVATLQFGICCSIRFMYSSSLNYIRSQKIHEDTSSRRASMEFTER
jgi:hypothetical protein